MIVNVELEATLVLESGPYQNFRSIYLVDDIHDSLFKTMVRLFVVFLVH